MGAEESKMPNLRRVDLEICLERILGHLKLQLDRKVNELITNDIKLREKMSERLREYSEVSIELIGLVNIKKNIDATKIILRYCKTLKDFSMKIVDAQNQHRFDYIEDLQPYIEGIIWSSDKLNNKYVQDFNNIIYRFFGKKVYNEVQRFGHVDNNLRNCFLGLEPTPSEIKQYLEQFLKRYKLEMKDYPTNGGGGSVGSKNKEDDKLDQLLDELKFDDGKKQEKIPTPHQNNIHPTGKNNNTNYPSNNYGGKPNNNIPPYNQNQGYPPYNQNQGNNIPPYNYGQQNQGNNIPPYNYGQQNQGNNVPPYGGPGSNQGDIPPYGGSGPNQGDIPPYGGPGINNPKPVNPNNNPDQPLPKDGNLDDLLNSLSQNNGISKVNDHNQNNKDNNNLDDLINNLTSDTKENNENSQKPDNNFDDMINNLQNDDEKNKVNDTKDNQKLIDELNKKNLIIGQRINSQDVNYPEAKKYDQSYVNKENDYKIDFSNFEEKKKE